MSENEVPPPAEIPAFAHAQPATQARLLVIDHVQAHSRPSPYIIAGRAMIVNVQSQVETNFMTVSAINTQQNGAQ